MPSSLQRALVAACLLLAAGCIFAPPKYGSRGVALPGSSQYDLYLQHCKDRYSELAKYCEKWGEPSAIQIGNSGGYFVWRGRQEWLKVRSFAATLMVARHPGTLRPFVMDNAAGSATASIARRDGPAAKNAQASAGASYVVESFARTADDDFAYAFRLRLKDGADAGLGALNRIKQELRQEVVSDYVSAYGGNMGDVKVDFPEFSMKDSMIEGRAEVMRIAVKSLRYDAQAQKGVIAVKIGAHRFEDARMWVRKNIESLAKDKNVALTTGQIPPAARFYLGAERVLEGNVLEIEFETE